MTFQDLPDDWSDRSLTPDLLPDIVDLFVSDEAKSAGCLALLVLDSELRMLQPIVISEMAGHRPGEGGGDFLEQFAAMLDESGARVVAALGRLGDVPPSEGDVAWASYLRDSLGGRLVGVFLATRDAVVEIGPTTAAA